MTDMPETIWAEHMPICGDKWWTETPTPFGMEALTPYRRADLASPLGAVKCRTCDGTGSVSTTDIDRNGDHVEMACPDCSPPTDADLDRAALDRPKVRALVEALIDISNGKTPFSNATIRRLCGKARAALTALDARHD